DHHELHRHSPFRMLRPPDGRRLSIRRTGFCRTDTGAEIIPQVMAGRPPHGPDYLSCQTLPEARLPPGPAATDGSRTRHRPAAIEPTSGDACSQQTQGEFPEDSVRLRIAAFRFL